MRLVDDTGSPAFFGLACSLVTTLPLVGRKSMCYIYMLFPIECEHPNVFRGDAIPKLGCLLHDPFSNTEPQVLSEEYATPINGRASADRQHYTLGFTTLHRSSNLCASPHSSKYRVFLVIKPGNRVGPEIAAPRLSYHFLAEMYTGSLNYPLVCREASFFINVIRPLRHCSSIDLF